MSICSVCRKELKVKGLNFCSIDCMEKVKYKKESILVKENVKCSFMSYAKKHPNKTERDKNYK